MAHVDAAGDFVARLGAPAGSVDDFSFEREGLRIHVKLRWAKDRILGAVLRVPFGAPIIGGSLKIRRETPMDRFGKRIRINREFQTGHREFDEACYVEADIPDRAIRGVLGRPGLAEIILRLLGRNGVTEFIVDADGSVALFVPTKHFAWDATVKQSLGELPRIVEILRGQGSEAEGYRGLARAVSPPDLRTFSPPAWVAMVLIMGATFIGMVVASAVSGNTPTPPLEWSWMEAGGSFLATVVALALLTLLFRGRSTGLRNFGITASVAVLPLVYMSFVALSVANRQWDRGPRTRIEGTIFSYTSKGGTFLGGSVLGHPLFLGRDLFIGHLASSPIGTTEPATFLIGSGALGARWVTDVTTP